MGFGWKKPQVSPAEQLADAQAQQRREAEALQAAQSDYRKMIDDNVAPPESVIDKTRVEQADGAKRPPTADMQTLADRLMGRHNVADLLDDKLNDAIVDFVKQHFEMSYDRISQRYDHWREAEAAHDVYVPAETASLSSSKNSGRSPHRNRPRLIDTIKVPYSRAISDTICTYNLSIFGGPRPFGIQPVGRKGKRLAAKIIEIELSQNMRRIGYEAKIHQMTMDQNRYGMAPTGLFYGDLGNHIVNLDPWGYFPDPRVTAQTGHDREFTGYRHWASLSALYRRRLYRGLDKLDDSGTSRQALAWRCNKDTRDEVRGQSVDFSEAKDARGTDKKWVLGDAHIINTLFIFLHPKRLGIPAPFGLYRIAVADETRVILFDRMPYPHGELPVHQGDAMFDAHKTFMSGNYDLLMPLQRFQDWLLRSRVENVQSIIQTRIVADPTKININDVLRPNAARLIRMLPGGNLEQALKIVETSDATSRYWNDIATTGELMQRLTSANDTAQGIQTEGTRTATEIARLTALGQQRLGTNARLMSAMHIRPMVQQMVSNLQYFSLDGGSIPVPSEMLADVDKDGLLDWSVTDIVGQYDYVIVDGTLPVDAKENAEVLLRAVKIIADLGLSTEWDLKKFVERAIQQMGFDDIDTWKLAPDEARARAAALARFATPNTQVVPNEVIMRQVEKGDAVPLREALPSAPGAVPPAQSMV